MVNKQNSLMGLVPYPDYPNTLMSFSSQKAEMSLLSLLSNRCFFLFYLVVQRTMRPKIKAKLFSGT